jgi:hypothetical protein
MIGTLPARIHRLESTLSRLLHGKGRKDGGQSKCFLPISKHIINILSSRVKSQEVSWGAIFIKGGPTTYTGLYNDLLGSIHEYGRLSRVRNRGSRKR